MGHFEKWSSNRPNPCRSAAFVRVAEVDKRLKQAGIRCGRRSNITIVIVLTQFFPIISLQWFLIRLALTICRLLCSPRYEATKQ